MIASTRAALLAVGGAGAAVALSSTLDWAWTAAGVALAMGGAFAASPRAIGMRVAPLAIGCAILAAVGLTRLAARAL